MRYGVITAALAAAWLAASPVTAQDEKKAAPQKPASAQANAELKDRDGKTIGRAQLTETPHGVLLNITLEGAPPGERAFHIHQVGRCDPPTFESAGGHLNPAGAQHGFLNPKGTHAGDLPNIHIPRDGRLTVEMLARDVTLQAGPKSLLDDDGSAVVMHAKPDDYRSDPAGLAGDRIACGVIQK